MTKAGLGISLLPPKIFQYELEQGQLHRLDTTLALKPIAFQAAYFRSNDTYLAARVADVACEVSNFDKCR